MLPRFQFSTDDVWWIFEEHHRHLEFPDSDTTQGSQKLGTIVLIAAVTNGLLPHKKNLTASGRFFFEAVGMATIYCPTTTVS